jgi:hypothetical protein
MKDSVPLGVKTITGSTPEDPRQCMLGNVKPESFPHGVLARGNRDLAVGRIFDTLSQKRQEVIYVTSFPFVPVDLEHGHADQNWIVRSGAVLFAHQCHYATVALSVDGLLARKLRVRAL